MIHQYKLNGYNIVLDICSGSVHAVDEIAYDIISMFESAEKTAVLESICSKYPEVSAEEIEECYDDIYQMWLLARLEIDHYADRKDRIADLIEKLNN